MAAHDVAPDTKKQRLTAERVLDGAMALADQIGVRPLTIRRLADALDTKPIWKAATAVRGSAPTRARVRRRRGDVDPTLSVVILMVTPDLSVVDELSGARGGSATHRRRTGRGRWCVG